MTLGLAGRPVPTEHQEQCAVIEWFDMRYRGLRGRLAAVPNGGLRHKAVAGQLKAEGVRKGYPDLQLLVPHSGHHGLIIEMKRVRGSRIEPEQLEWLEWFAAMGYRAVVCKGFEAAKGVIEDYLAGFDERKKRIA